jgi:hypothetical protein
VFEILDLSLNAIDESSELRTSLRATFLALSSLTKHEGIIDLSAYPPGTRALSAALDAVEKFSEKRLMTRSSLEPIIKAISS